MGKWGEMIHEREQVYSEVVYTLVQGPSAFAEFSSAVINGGRQRWLMCNVADLVSQTHALANITSHTKHWPAGWDQLGGSAVQKERRPITRSLKERQTNKVKRLVILCQWLHQSFWGKVAAIVLGHPFTFTVGNHGNKQPLANSVSGGNHWRLSKRHSQKWKCWHTCC